MGAQDGHYGEPSEPANSQSLGEAVEEQACKELEREIVSLESIITKLHYRHDQLLLSITHITYQQYAVMERENTKLKRMLLAQLY
jgi:DNA-directed RNA polymerase specialized sigma54-like protein